MSELKKQARLLTDKEVLAYLQEASNTSVIKPINSVAARKAHKDSKILEDEALRRMQR